MGTMIRRRMVRLAGVSGALMRGRKLATWVTFLIVVHFTRREGIGGLAFSRPLQMSEWDGRNALRFGMSVFLVPGAGESTALVGPERGA